MTASEAGNQVLSTSRKSEGSDAATGRNALPNGWELKRLADPEVCLLNPRKSEIASLPDNAEVTFVPMASIDAERGAIVKPECRHLGEVRKGGFTYFREGDVLFAKITPCMENGKAVIARNLKNGIGFGTTELHVLRPGSRVLAEWLHHFVRQQAFREEAASRMTGSAGQQRVPVSFLEEADILIPPLPEQRRIVARIEEFARRVEEIVNLRSEMETFSYQILLGAYGKIADDAPTMPLGKIAELKRRSIKIDPGKDYLELGVRSFGKGTFHKPAIPGASIVKNIYAIEPGDLVFNNVFGWEGAVAVANPEDKGRVGSHRFLTYVPKEGVAKSSFICFHFLTERGLQQLGEASPGTAGRNRTLGIKALERTAIPVPSFDKQVWFDAIQNQMNAILNEQSKMENELEMLMPSVLAKAFAGEF